MSQAIFRLWVRRLPPRQRYSRDFNWYLKLDVHKYFDSISHIILMKLMEKLIKDYRLLQLLWRIIDSTGGEKGIPIGNLTSQHFGNLYLTALDYYVKQELRTKGYVRYMDDFLLFGQNKEELKEKLKLVKTFLFNNLKLELNEPQMNYCVKGIPYLGYRIFPDKMRLTPKSRKRFRHHIKQAWCELDNGLISQSEFARKADTLLAFVNYSNERKFRECRS